MSDELAVRRANTARRSLRPPDLQRMMARDLAEILIRRQQRQLEADAELREQCVDGSDLHSVSSTFVAKVGGGNVVTPLRLHAGQGGEAVEDRVARSRSVEALKQLLQDESSREDGLITPEASP